MGKKCPSKSDIFDLAKKFREEQKQNKYYKNQYLLNSDIDQASVEFQDLSREGNTPTLYKNMRLLGLSDEIWVKEALYCGFSTKKLHRSPTHHIIPINFLSDSSIKIDLHKIIDDGRNGIILPNISNCEYNFTLGTAHGNHSSEYEQFIKEQLSKCISTNDVWEMLDDIKPKLYEGSLPLCDTNTKNT